MRRWSAMGLDRDLGYDGILSDDEYLIRGALRGSNDRIIAS